MPRLCQNRFATVTASLIHVGAEMEMAGGDPPADELFAKKGEARPSGAGARILDLHKTARQSARMRVGDAVERSSRSQGASPPNGAATEALTMAKAARALCNELREAVASAAAGH